MHAEGRAFGLNHALGKTANNIQSLLGDVHQPQFGQGKGVNPCQKTVD